MFSVRNLVECFLHVPVKIYSTYPQREGKAIDPFIYICRDEWIRNNIGLA